MSWLTLIIEKLWNYCLWYLDLLAVVLEVQQGSEQPNAHIRPCGVHSRMSRVPFLHPCAARLQHPPCDPERKTAIEKNKYKSTSICTVEIFYKSMVMHVSFDCHLFIIRSPKTTVKHLIQKSSCSFVAKPAKALPESTWHLLKYMEENVCNVKRGLRHYQGILKPLCH